ncbi:hypothetical protein [Gordonia polyisoprenivorans]|uniref:hypothetical protein n=1 Tax=Gordonia polyisoprenivorans TaxID=84595 RepID=UPI00201340B3|nr:hypothetical protein [Gordonia polyisoprenivorans]
MADLTRVGILAYPGCFASEIFGITDVLTMGGHVARAHHQEPSLVTSIVSPRRRVVAPVTPRCRCPRPATTSTYW